MTKVIPASLCSARSPCFTSSCPIHSPASGNGWRHGLPHLEVRNLSASYGPLKVLHGIDLSLERGEVVALIGPSGSGKSTILRVLVGLTPCTGGEFILDGVPIRYNSATSVRAARDRMAI